MGADSFNARSRANGPLVTMGVTCGVVALLTCAAEVRAEREPWVAPSDAVGTVSPQHADDASVARGKAVYSKRCVDCHGKTGHGDGPDAADLSVEPGKFDGDLLTKETDGALFWKVRTGRKPMPKYSNRISEQETWDVVNYIRTLGKK